GPAAVNYLDQFGQAGHETVVVDAELATAVPPGLLRGGHFDGNEPDPAGGAGLVVGERVLGDEAFRVRAARRHRWQPGAGGNFDCADPRRSQQNAHGIGESPPASLPVYERPSRRAMKARRSNRCTSCSFLSSAPCSGGISFLGSRSRRISGPMSSTISNLSQSSSSEVDGFFFNPGTSRIS